MAPTVTRALTGHLAYRGEVQSGATVVGEARDTDSRLVRWGVPLAVYALSRLVATLLLVEGATRQASLTVAGWPFYLLRDQPARPSYLDVVTNWDGQFYELLATRGYVTPTPGVTPVPGEEFAWTFPPLFPALVRLVMRLTGASFPVAATGLNLVLGAATAVLLYALVRRTAGRYVAVAAVATTFFFVSAPILQAAYSESLALLLLVLVLSAVSRGHWGRAVVGVVLLMFTRIVTPPLLLVALLHLFLRVRRGGTLRRRDLVGAPVFMLLSLLGPFIWSWAVGRVRQGNAGAGRATTTAAEATSWFEQAFRYGGAAGLVVVALLALVLLLMPFTRVGRSLGPELSTWLWGYPAMLLAVTLIQPGMLRYLVLAPALLVPFLGPFVRYRRGRWVALGVLLALLVAGQWWFVDALMVVDSPTQRFGP